jgi:hypothetical protein
MLKVVQASKEASRFKGFNAESRRVVDHLLGNLDGDKDSILTG